MKVKVESRWRDADGKVHTFYGEGDTVNDCTRSIIEQMTAIEDDENSTVTFVLCESGRVVRHPLWGEIETRRSRR